MNADTYEDLAESYDLSFEQFGEHEPQVVEFFRWLFAQNNVHTVLDCACGTERHLLLFHSLEYKVWGSDVSEAMLAQARKNTAHLGDGVFLQQADYRDLPQHFIQSVPKAPPAQSPGAGTQNRRTRKP